MNDNTFRIIELVFKLVFALLATYVAPYVVKWMKDRKVDSIFKNAVQAVQQTAWDKDGKIRKEKATELIKLGLEKTHIKMTDEQISILIESFVKEMKLAEGVKYDTDKK